MAIKGGLHGGMAQEDSVSRHFQLPDGYMSGV